MLLFDLCNFDLGRVDCRSVWNKVMVQLAYKVRQDEEISGKLSNLLFG